MSGRKRRKVKHPSRALSQSVRPFFLKKKQANLLREHVQHEHLSKQFPRHKNIRADRTNIGILKELKQVDELKVLTENVHQSEPCVLHRATVCRRGLRWTTAEASQEQMRPFERSTRKAPKAWRRGSRGGRCGGFGASVAREVHCTT